MNDERKSPPLQTTGRTAERGGRDDHSTPDPIVPTWWWRVLNEHETRAHRFDAIGVALQLSQHRNYRTGRLTWRQAVIAERLGVSRQRVNAALGVLVELGIVSRCKIGKLCEYRVNLRPVRESETDTCHENPDSICPENPDSICPESPDSNNAVVIHPYLNAVDDARAQVITGLVERGIARRLAEQAVNDHLDVARAWLEAADWHDRVPWANNPIAAVSAALRDGQLPEPPASRPPQADAVAMYGRISPEVDDDGLESAESNVLAVTASPRADAERWVRWFYAEAVAAEVLQPVIDVALWCRRQVDAADTLLRTYGEQQCNARAAAMFRAIRRGCRSLAPTVDHLARGWEYRELRAELSTGTIEIDDDLQRRLRARERAAAERAGLPV